MDLSPAHQPEAIACVLVPAHRSGGIRAQPARSQLRSLRRSRGALRKAPNGMGRAVAAGPSCRRAGGRRDQRQRKRQDPRAGGAWQRGQRRLSRGLAAAADRSRQACRVAYVPQKRRSHAVGDMELSVAPRELTTPALSDVVTRYLAAMPVTAAVRDGLRAQVAAQAQTRGVDPADPKRALHLLHEVLAGRELEGADPGCASARRRLELAFGAVAGTEIVAVDVKGRDRLLCTPPVERAPMAPRRWSFRSRARNQQDEPDRGSANPAHPRSKDPWQRVGAARRFALLGLVLAQTWFATSFMAAILPYHGRPPLEFALVSLFAVLFAWISAGFWTAIAGFVLLWAGGDRFAISRTLGKTAAAAPLAEDARIAIVMPVANEDIRRVFAGVRAMYESLAQTPDAGHFDFFVLSDSSDPDTRVGERH